MFYVYRFLDKKKNIIYVGKSKQELEERFRGHLHLPDACYDLTYKIEYIECTTASDMSIKEIYYINKYYHDGVFFNVLDMTDVPISVEFNDKWKQYKGPLDEQFHHSINYTKGYTKEKVLRYNRDGTLDRRKPNKQKGTSSFVDGLTVDEVNLIINYLINQINNAENENQEQIRFRNLLVFVLGVNVPMKADEFLRLKYRDLFDENDCPKSVALNLGRFHKDEIINIPLKEVVKKVLLAYTEYSGLSYENNADDNLFVSREHQVMSAKTWGHILKSATASVGIEKNIGSGSVRKTYGRNIYNCSPNKLEALCFLGEIWGNIREAKVIEYLNLTDGEIDFEYYLGEAFSIGTVDLTKIDCLKRCSIVPIESGLVTATSKSKSKGRQRIKNNVEDCSTRFAVVPVENTKTTSVSNDQDGVQKQIKTRTDPIDPIPKKKYRVWSKDKKLEIVKKHIDNNISMKELAKEYGVDRTNICHWINDYREYGEVVFEDKRRKPK